MTQYIAYYRVSTERQGRSGLGLDAQRTAVALFEPVAEYTDIESGKNNDRPELAAALAQCKEEGATLVVAKLDRLSRDAAFLLTLRATSQKIMVADSPSMGPLEYGIKAVISEDERRNISLRTQAALKAARERGVKLGFAAPSRLQGQRMASEAGVRGNIERAERHAAKVRPIIRTIQAAGAITLRDIAGQLNELGVLTARGGRWHPSTVNSILARLEEAA